MMQSIMVNYLGQLRLYSLIDLFVLLIAVKATTLECIGAVFLHVGFLAYLETQHGHSYRRRAPQYLWVLLAFIGLVSYGHLEGLPFIIFSYLYTLKTKNPFALFSPLMRGLQTFFLVAGIVGYGNSLAWIAFVLLTTRNFSGDLRDIAKDKKENLKTLPVAMGMNRDMKYVHLAVTLATTFFWFEYTSLNLWILVPIFLTQILTYNLTPR